MSTILGILMQSNKLRFSWESSGNVDDLSGIARFAVGHESVTVAMDNFAQAAKLNRLFEKACDWEKHQTIDRAIGGISNLLHGYRYD
jgi:hypothetical protein